MFVNVYDNYSGNTARVDDDGRLIVSIEIDDNFKKELKSLICEIMSSIAEGQLLAPPSEDTDGV